MREVSTTGAPGRSGTDCGPRVWATAHRGGDQRSLPGYGRRRESCSLLTVRIVAWTAPRKEDFFYVLDVVFLARAWQRE